MLRRCVVRLLLTQLRWSRWMRPLLLLRWPIEAKIDDVEATSTGDTKVTTHSSMESYVHIDKSSLEGLVIDQCL